MKGALKWGQGRWNRLCQVPKVSLRSSDDLSEGQREIVQLLSHVQLFVTPKLQHIRLPCPSLSHGVFSNSCPLSQWCHPTISSSLSPFSSCPQSFPASECFPMSQFFTLGGQSIEVSASASVLPMNIHGWFHLGLIFLMSKGLSRVFSSSRSKAMILDCSDFFMVQLSHPYTPTGKTIALTIWTFVGKVISLILICCLVLS